MGNRVSVEGCGRMSSLSVASRSLRLIALAALAAVVTACGGGGGGGDGGGNPPPPDTGSLRVTVTDTSGVSVNDADVRATVGSASKSGSTDAAGVVLLSGVNVGTASVEVSRSTFVSQTVSATITADQTTDLAVQLVRATSAAGGSLTSRGAGPVVVGNNMTFEIEVIVVDSDSQPITNLTAADFVLNACVEDTNTARADCVIKQDITFDSAYSSTTATAQLAVVVPGGAAQPYAAGLLLDQSRSISGSDPTGARLFSAKAFLDGLGGGDHALLAAFAKDDTTAAEIPTQPLTVYPPFRDATTADDAPSYYDTLDSLADLVGGGTPLYESLDLLRDEVLNDATLPAGIAKAIVLFTDGEDTFCGGPNTCRTRRNTSIQNAGGLRFFTIGLSTAIDFEAMADLANKSGGAFLFANSAEQLIPLYGTVGELLSLSLPTYRLTFSVDADDPNAFVNAIALRGRVTVDAGTGSGTFEVPFIVGVP